MAENKKFIGSVSIAPVISPGVTFISPTLADFDKLLHGQEGNETYGRYANPTLDSAENFLERKFGAERALVFASGMAAVSTTVLSLIQPGTRVIYGNQCYRKTDELFRLIAEKFNVQVTGFSP